MRKNARHTSGEATEHDAIFYTRSVNTCSALITKFLLNYCYHTPVLM